MAIVLIVLLIVLIIFSIIYLKWFKVPKMKNVIFIDGSLGTGKSALTVCLAIRMYKRQVRHHKWRLIFSHIPMFKRWKNDEMPLLYSNIKLRGIDYVPLTNDLIVRKNVRYAYKSVVILDEFSLIADQNMYGKKFEEVTERMSEFFKLFRHQTKGGYMFINSQSTSDLNFTLKSVLSDYFYIHSKSSRFVPIIQVLRVQECRYSRDNSSLQVNIYDVEDNLKVMVMLKKWFRFYDTYCHSIFTDMLPVQDNKVRYNKGDSLKTDNLVTYKDYSFLYENIDMLKDKKESGVIYPKEINMPKEINVEVVKNEKKD